MRAISPGCDGSVIPMSSDGCTSQRSCSPVITRPGWMQDTCTPVLHSSMRKASESASMANLVPA